MISQRIGNYRIVRQLGMGGMGAVYEAIHERINRRAAIKVLRTEHAGNPDVVKRFVAEARAVNLIGHPNVVNIYELGQMQDGATFIIMEYLDGVRLSDRIPRDPGLVAPWVLQVARQVVLALQAAHDKGIIHRDLKPDNIMIVPDAEAPGGERVKVLDFGIAKMSAPSGDGESETTDVRTRTGMLMGTPKYMSPEQCRGAGGVTAMTDVYALGVILYELLAGRAPFVQRRGDGPGDMLVRHLTEVPLPLLRQNPGVPPALAEMVHEMLAKKPEDRPSLKKVLAQLDERLRTAERTSAFSTRDGPRPSIFPERRSRMAGLTPRPSAGRCGDLAGVTAAAQGRLGGDRGPGCLHGGLWHGRGPARAAASASDGRDARGAEYRRVRAASGRGASAADDQLERDQRPRQGAGLAGGRSGDPWGDPAELHAARGIGEHRCGPAPEGIRRQAAFAESGERRGAERSAGAGRAEAIARGEREEAGDGLSDVWTAAEGQEL